MRKNRLQRLATLLVLLVCWMAPAAQAIGVGLHVAMEPGHDWDGSHDHVGLHGHSRAHDHEADEERDGSPDPIAPDSLDADHGHRHVIAAPDSGPPAVRPGALAGMDETLGTVLAWCDAEIDPYLSKPASAGLESSRRSGPPAPLIYAHCALLR